MLAFGPGVSCIVGPNGCGKSNIVDALKWCMGEQSAKSLRGGEMLDVIFGGSAERPPMGFAEVAITFTAEDGEPFPGEYARFTELAVGRRLHRTGASEYFIGGARCRRRDIIELFMDTGVGNNLYSFIEQGSIGKIVHASPAERRTLIDEAAGISKYKVRRKEAQSRLEATAAQLDRAADVAEEMGRRLKELERQVVRSARFRRLRALQRQDEILLALAKFADLAADRRRLRTDLREARARSEQAERMLVRRERELSGRREELELSEQQVNLLRDELAELDASLRETHGAQTYAERRAGEITAQLERWEGELKDATSLVEAAMGEVEAHRTNDAALGEEIIGLEAREAPLREALRLATADRGEARQVLSGLESEVSQHAAKMGGLQATSEALAARSVAIPEQEAVLRLSIEEAERSVASVAERQGVAEARIQSVTEQLAALASEESAVGTRASDAAARLRAMSESLAQAEAQLESEESSAARAVETSEQALLEAEAAQQREADERRRALASAHLELRRAHERRARDADTTRKNEVRAAEKRAAQWLRAAERRTAERVQRLRRGLMERRAGLEREGQDLRAVAEQDIRRARDAGLVALSANQQQRLEAVAASVQDARDALTEAKEEQEVAQRQWSLAIAAESDARGSLAAVEARLRDLTAAASGGGAVAEALAHLPVLGDVTALPEDAAAWMGDRVNLRVASDVADVLKAAEAASEGGTGRVLFVPRGRGASAGGEAVQQIERAYDLVGTLEEALQGFAFSGRAAVVASTGEAVLSDGVVLLGGAGEGVFSAAEARSQREEARDAVARAEGEKTDAQQRLAAAEEGVRRSSEHLERAAENLATSRAAHAKERAEILESLEREAEARRADALAATATLRASLAEAEAQAELDAGAWAGEVDVLREEVAAAVAEMRAACEQERDASIARSAARMEEELAELGEAEQVASIQLEPLRDEVRRCRELRRTLLTAGRESVDRAREREREARKELDARREAQRRTAENRSELELERAECTHEQLRLRGEASAARASIAGFESQIADLHRESSRNASERAATADALSQLRATQRGLEERIAEAREVLDGREGRENEVREALARWQRDLAGIQERRRAAVSAREACERRLRDAAVARGRAEERLASGRTELDDIRAESEELARASASLGTHRAGCWDKLERERERVRELREAWHAVEEDLRRLMSARDEHAREVAGFEVRVSELQGEVDGLKQRIDERYQLSLPGLLDRMEATGRLRIDSDPLAAEDLVIGGLTLEGVPARSLSPSDLHDFDGIRELVEVVEARREEIRRLGDVHLGALEEYRELEVRHADLVAQRTDLEESMASIRAAIAKMNRTSRQRFRDAFDRVDEHFQELYPRLVGGGRARLSLTDEDDLLETGVDIFVQPPGKRLQNLTLLSGGEKAMSAIALLMALFKVRPSPFCVLDEVDAPLDEANGGRFNEMIREMSTTTQFLVVTHNKKTMESGDTLYGITMPTAGASKVVSVRIDGPTAHG